MQRDQTRHDGQTETKRRATVQEAARLLDTTVEGVRARIKRGSLDSMRVSGTVYVLLNSDQAQPGDRTSTDDQARPDQMLVEALRDQIETLRGELADWKEEARRKDMILMRMAERIPELEASPASPSQEATDARETAPETVRGEEDAKGHAGAQMGSKLPRRSFWSRLFGR